LIGKDGLMLQKT